MKLARRSIPVLPGASWCEVGRRDQMLARMICAAFGVSFIFASPASGQSGRRPSPMEEQLSGCYRVELGEWVEAPGGAPPSFPVPDRVQLLLEPYRTDAWRLEPGIDGFEPLSGIRPAWHVIEPDSVRLRWSDGFRGVSITVRLGSETEGTGHAEPITDAIIIGRLPGGSTGPLPLPRAPARLTRVECSTEAS